MGDICKVCYYRFGWIFICILVGYYIDINWIWCVGGVGIWMVVVFIVWIVWFVGIGFLCDFICGCIWFDYVFVCCCGWIGFENGCDLKGRVVDFVDSGFIVFILCVFVFVYLDF